MSSKLLQSSYRKSTRIVRVKVISLPWMRLDDSLEGEGDGFLHSWLEQDLEEHGEARSRIHWGAACGLALAFVLSAGFWSGVGLLISRFT